jgi:hypothetical protein
VDPDKGGQADVGLKLISACHRKLDAAQAAVFLGKAVEVCVVVRHRHKQFLGDRNVLPGPVATPQRNRTHPAEDATALPAADTIAAGYLYLLDPAGASASGALLDMRTDGSAGMQAA